MRHHWSSTRRRVPSNTSTCDSPVSPGRNRLQLAQKLVASGMVSISGSDVCIISASRLGARALRPGPWALVTWYTKEPGVEGPFRATNYQLGQL